MPKPNIFYRQVFKYGSQFKADFNKYVYNRLRNVEFNNIKAINDNIPIKESLIFKNGEYFLLTAITASYSPFIVDGQAVDLPPLIRFIVPADNRKLNGAPDDPEVVLPEVYTSMKIFSSPGMDINPLRGIRAFSYMFKPKSILQVEVLHTWPRANWLEEIPQDLKIDVSFLGLAFRPSSLKLKESGLS